MSLVVWLENLSGDTLDRAGGKAANLGEMLRAGLPVPTGFVLTTDAYEQFVTRNALQSEIEGVAQSASADDAAALDRAAQSIGALFAAGTMPEAVADALRDAYRQMGGPTVAVRSSATAEDLSGASFAGQMESYLNIRGEEAQLAAVRRCWASLWTARAISYRARQGIPHAGVRLAVVVQQLVEADAAGVLFTANPVNGHRGQMVIDAVWGLGEALVGGQATPDHWVVEAGTGKVLEAHITRKTVMTVATTSGTRLDSVPEGMQNRPILDENQVVALVDLGRRAAAHFGAPQDVEWAIAGGRLYLVQSRPITSLFPLPHPLPAAKDGLRVYLSFNIMQGVVEPLTPLGISVFRSIFNAMAAFKYGVKVRPGESAPAFKVAAGRLYLDITVPLKSRKARHAFPRLTGIMDHHVAEILRTLVEREPRLAAERRGLPIALSPGFIARLLGQILHVLVSPETASQRLLLAAERVVRQIEQQADTVADPAACRRFVQETMTALWPQLVYSVMPVVIPAIASRFLAEALLRRWGIDPAALQPVLRSLPHNPTMEMDLALFRISRVLKAEGAEPSAEHPAVQKFLSRYGHRAVREIDAGMPRWREEPGHVLEVLRTYLHHEEEADAEQKFREGERAAEESSAGLVQQVRQGGGWPHNSPLPRSGGEGRRGGWLRSRVLAFLLRRVRALLGRREVPKFLLVRILAALRRMVSRAGTSLAAAGRLERTDDVFFLDLNDLDSPGDLRAFAERNRAEYDREMTRKIIPRVMTSEGETFYTAPSTVPGALTGTAASPGVYEGVVRVIRDPAGAKLLPGEVLVAVGTDPAWTPLFLSAGALVMELGGIMSHGSVVAREYGIPAVVGVPDATRHLETGQRVRVDGESGQVVPLSPREAAPA
jgi:pyruvate,water dikinase